MEVSKLRYVQIARAVKIVSWKLICCKKRNKRVSFHWRPCFWLHRREYGYTFMHAFQALFSIIIRCITLSSYYRWCSTVSKAVIVCPERQNPFEDHTITGCTTVRCYTCEWITIFRVMLWLSVPRSTNVRPRPNSFRHVEWRSKGVSEWDLNTTQLFHQHNLDVFGR